MIFIGINKELTGYRLLNPKNNKVIIRREVVFNEKEFPNLDDKSEVAEIPSTQRNKSNNKDIPIHEREFLPPAVGNPVEPNNDNVENEIPDQPPLHNAQTKIADNSLNNKQSENVNAEEKTEPKATKKNLTSKNTKKSESRIYQDLSDGNRLGKRISKPNPKYAQMVQEPKSFLEARKYTKWNQAMIEELKSLKKNNTWTLVPLPSGRKPINCKWTFKLKKDENYNISRYKARLVGVGTSQREGIDFLETFSPVVRWETIRTLLTISLNRNLQIHHLDVETAFLNGDIDKEIFMRQPPGFSENNNLVCKLNKAIYGLKQSSHLWNEKLKEKLKK